MTIYCYILAKNQSYSTIRRASLLLKTFINTCLFTNKRVKKFLYKQLDETHVIQHEILYYLVFAFNMASKRKELNTSQRAQIIGAWKVGSSLRKIAQTLDHPYTTVQNVIKIKELLSLLLEGKTENNVRKKQTRFTGNYQKG